MKKWAFMIVVLALGTNGFAEEQPKTTTVGGGVSNPWRSPYKTAVTTTVSPAGAMK